jgi:hypothetical protein
MVGPFFSVRLETNHQFEALNLASKDFRKPLGELASVFTQKYLGISDAVLTESSIHSLCNSASQYHTATDTSVDIAQVLQDALPLAEANRILAAISEQQRINTQKALSRMVESQNLAHGPPTVSPPNKRQRLSGPVSTPPGLPPPIPAGAPTPSIGPAHPSAPHPLECKRDYQAESKNRALTKAETLDLVCDCIKEISELKQAGQTLDSNCKLRSWANKASKVVVCLNQCHAGSRTAFLEANQKFTLTTFNICSKQVKHKTHIP